MCKDTSQYAFGVSRSFSSPVVGGLELPVEAERLPAPAELPPHAQPWWVLHPAELVLVLVLEVQTDPGSDDGGGGLVGRRHAGPSSTLNPHRPIDRHELTQQPGGDTSSKTTFRAKMTSFPVLASISSLLSWTTSPPTGLGDYRNKVVSSICFFQFKRIKSNYFRHLLVWILFFIFYFTCFIKLHFCFVFLTFSFI